MTSALLVQKLIRLSFATMLLMLMESYMVLHVIAHHLYEFRVVVVGF